MKNKKINIPFIFNYNIFKYPSYYIHVCIFCFNICLYFLFKTINLPISNLFMLFVFFQLGATYYLRKELFKLFKLEYHFYNMLERNRIVILESNKFKTAHSPYYWGYINKYQLKLFFQKDGLNSSEDIEKFANSISEQANFEFDSLETKKFHTLNFSKFARPIQAYNKINPKKKAITLDSKKVWDITTEPNFLICGKTGSGKSKQLEFFLLQFSKITKEKYIYIFDVKKSISKNVIGRKKYYTDTAKIVIELENLITLMNSRYEMNRTQLQKEPHIFICIEELIALKSELSKVKDKETKMSDFTKFEAYLNTLIVKCRAANMTIGILTQVASAELFGNSGMRNQLHLVIYLGKKISQEECKMLFNRKVANIPQNNSKIIGSGLIEIHGDVFKYISPRFNKKNTP